MIENMRKYTGLMVVVLVLLAAGLILTMGTFKANTGRKATVATAYGEAIDQSRFRKMGPNSLKVIKASGDMNLINYAVQTGGFYASPQELQFLATARPDLRNLILHQITSKQLSNEALIQFVANRIVIKTEAAKLGIHASEDRALEYIQNTMFAKEGGGFDEERYNAFIKDIGQSGYREADFIKLVAEFSVYSKLQNALTGGIQENRKLSETAALFNMQTIDASTIELDIETYKKGISPTEEELKQYWTLNEGKYQTQRELKLSYILIKSTFSTPEPVPAERTEGMKDDQYEKLDKAYKVKLAEWNTAKNKAALETDGMVDDFSIEIEDNEGKDFVKISKENGFNPVTTELFSADTPPAELKDLKNTDGESIITFLFNSKFGTSEKHQVKAPVKTTDGSWFYCKLDAENIPTAKSFEAAKEQATADYTKEKAKEAMTKAADDIKAQLTKAIKEGKTVEEAAKSLNLTAVRSKSLTAPTQASTRKEAGTFQYASLTDANTFSKDNVDLGDKLALIYLHKRAVYNTPETSLAISQAASQSSSYLANQLFRSWLHEATTKAEIKFN